MPAIIGQHRALDILRSALRGGRMHHAWIFHGPAGVGKFTTARWLAQVLLCHAPTGMSEGEPCGTCESCRVMQAPDGAHPDLHVIQKELAAFSAFSHLRGKKQMNIPIDLLRELMLGGWVGEKYLEAPVAKSPMLRHNKVFILDEAELLDDAGASALLKTLEEPSPGTYIILVTTHEDQLLQTIRSRCQRVAFGTLPDDAVQQWLSEQEASATMSEEQRTWVMKFARGSLGKARLALEYNLGEWYAALTPLVKQTAAGQATSEFGPKMAALVEAFAKSWVDEHEGASKDAANKAGVRHMLGLLGELCRFALRHVAEKAPKDDLDAADRLINPWLIGIDLLQQAEGLLESNVSPPLILDNLAIQWAALSQPQTAGR